MNSCIIQQQLLSDEKHARRLQTESVDSNRLTPQKRKDSNPNNNQSINISNVQRQLNYE